MTSRLFIAVLALASAACGPKDSNSETTPASAAATGEGSSASPVSSAEPMTSEVSNYTLDMDKMRKLVNTSKYVEDAKKRDPSLDESLEMGSGTTNAQIIATLESNPATRDALRKAGWSARDYLLTMAAFLQAGITQEMLASSPGGKLPEGHNPKNIEFLKANKTELKRMADAAGVEIF